jgi:hypothetical protein
MNKVPPEILSRAFLPVQWEDAGRLRLSRYLEHLLGILDHLANSRDPQEIAAGLQILTRDARRALRSFGLSV